MAKVYDSVLDLVGKTPLLNAHSFKENNKLDGNILVKLEYFNPADHHHHARDHVH